MTTSTINDRVARGAALLDEKFPGWVDQVDIASLNLSNGCSCILGQQFGDFMIGARATCLAVETAGVVLSQQSRDLLEEHGFLVNYTPREFSSFAGRPSHLSHAALSRVDAEYAELTTAWAKLITNRRAEAQLAELEELHALVA